VTLVGNGDVSERERVLGKSGRGRSDNKGGARRDHETKLVHENTPGKKLEHADDEHALFRDDATNMKSSIHRKLSGRGRRRESGQVANAELRV
jgi:hypothetical protein